MPTLAVMRLAEQGGAFDFWMDGREDIYSADDGEPVTARGVGTVGLVEVRR